LLFLFSLCKSLIIHQVYCRTEENCRSNKKSVEENRNFN
jgi:hypothetical protein